MAAGFDLKLGLSSGHNARIWNIYRN